MNIIPKAIKIEILSKSDNIHNSLISSLNNEKCGIAHLYDSAAQLNLLATYIQDVCSSLSNKYKKCINVIKNITLENVHSSKMVAIKTRLHIKNISPDVFDIFTDFLNENIIIPTVKFIKSTKNLCKFYISSKDFNCALNAYCEDREFVFIFNSRIINELLIKYNEQYANNDEIEEIKKFKIRCGNVYYCYMQFKDLLDNETLNSIFGISEIDHPNMDDKQTSINNSVTSNSILPVSEFSQEYPLKSPLKSPLTFSSKSSSKSSLRSPPKCISYPHQPNKLNVESHYSHKPITYIAPKYISYIEYKLNDDVDIHIICQSTVNNIINKKYVVCENMDTYPHIYHFFSFSNFMTSCCSINHSTHSESKIAVHTLWMQFKSYCMQYNDNNNISLVEFDRMIKQLFPNSSSCCSCGNSSSCSSCDNSSSCGNSSSCNSCNCSSRSCGHNSCGSLITISNGYIYGINVLLRFNNPCFNDILSEFYVDPLCKFDEQHIKGATASVDTNHDRDYCLNFYYEHLRPPPEANVETNKSHIPQTFKTFISHQEDIYSVLPNNNTSRNGKQPHDIRMFVSRHFVTIPIVGILDISNCPIAQHSVSIDVEDINDYNINNNNNDDNGDLAISNYYTVMASSIDVNINETNNNNMIPTNDKTPVGRITPMNNTISTSSKIPMGKIIPINDVIPTNDKTPVGRITPMGNAMLMNNTIPTSGKSAMGRIMPDSDKSAMGRIVPMNNMVSSKKPSLIYPKNIPTTYVPPHKLIKQHIPIDRTCIKLGNHTSGDYIGSYSLDVIYDVFSVDGIIYYRTKFENDDIGVCQFDADDDGTLLAIEKLKGQCGFRNKNIYYVDLNCKRHSMTILLRNNMSYDMFYNTCCEDYIMNCKAHEDIKKLAVFYDIFAIKYNMRVVVDHKNRTSIYGYGCSFYDNDHNNNSISRWFDNNVGDYNNIAIGIIRKFGEYTLYDDNTALANRFMNKLNDIIFDPTKLINYINLVNRNLIDILNSQNI